MTICQSHEHWKCKVTDKTKIVVYDMWRNWYLYALCISYNIIPFLIKDICKYMCFPQNISFNTFKYRLKAMPLPGLQCSCAFLTSVFILQTYYVSHKEIMLINYSDSDTFNPPHIWPVLPCPLYFEHAKTSVHTKTSTILSTSAQMVERTVDIRMKY